MLESGGHRVEVANASARLMLVHGWKMITWTEEKRKKGQAREVKTIATFHTHGTPPLPPEPGRHSTEVVVSVGDLPEQRIVS